MTTPGDGFRSQNSGEECRRHQEEDDPVGALTRRQVGPSQHLDRHSQNEQPRGSGSTTSRSHESSPETAAKRPRARHDKPVVKRGAGFGVVGTTRTVQAAAVAAPIAATAETAWWLGFDAAAPT